MILALIFFYTSNYSLVTLALCSGIKILTHNTAVIFFPVHLQKREYIMATNLRYTTAVIFTICSSAELVSFFV